MTKVIHKDNKFKLLLNRILSFTMVLLLITTFTYAGEGQPADGVATQDVTATNDSVGEVVDSVGEVVDEINAGEEEVYKTISEIISIMFTLGFAIAILKMCQIGFMFLMQGASSQTKAKISLIPWAVGALVCLSFSWLGPWVINMLMSGSTGSVFDI